MPPAPLRGRGCGGSRRSGNFGEPGRVAYGSFAWRRSLAGEDRGQAVHVHLLEHALAPRLPQSRLELGPEEIDLAVQDPPPVRDLLLLLRELVDQLLEIVVRERCEIGKRFHRAPFVGEAGAPSVSGAARKGQPQLETLASG